MAEGLRRIGLVGGSARVDLMVELGTGIETREVPVVRFDPSGRENLLPD